MPVTSVPVTLFLAFHFLAPFLEPGSSWGPHSLAYYPPVFWWLTAAATACLLIPVSNRFLIAATSGILQRVPVRARRFVATLGLLAIAISAGALSSAIHLLGDGYLYISELPGNRIRVDHSPLSFWLVRLLFEVGSPVLTAESAYQLYSSAGGALYLAITLFVARAIASDRTGRAVVIGILLTAGYVQGFCAYVETYSLVYAGLLFYVWTGLKAVAGRLPPITAGVALGIIIPLHFLLVTLAPSLFLILFLRGREAKNLGVRTLPRLSTATGTLAVVPAVTVIILLALGINPLGYFEWLDKSSSLPVLGGPGFTVIVVATFPPARVSQRRSAGLVSPDRRPAASGSHGRAQSGDRSIPRLGCPGHSISPSHGVGRRRPPSRDRRFATTHHRRRHPVWSCRYPFSAVDRSQREPRQGGAAVYGSDGDGRAFGARQVVRVGYAGRYYGDRGEPLLELEANEQALAASPENSMHWFNTGLVYLRLEHCNSALYCFERAVTIDTGFLDALDYMAQIRFQLGDVEEADDSLRRILQLNPAPEHEKRIRNWLQGQKQ